MRLARAGTPLAMATCTQEERDDSHTDEHEYCNEGNHSPPFDDDASAKHRIGSERSMGGLMVHAGMVQVTVEAEAAPTKSCRLRTTAAVVVGAKMMVPVVAIAVGEVMVALAVGEGARVGATLAAVAVVAVDRAKAK